MKALVYAEQGRFVLEEKPVPQLCDPRDAIVRVTLSSICSSDLHIKHGSVPQAVPGITVGHEMVGVVETVVTVNVETFCGECFFCQNGFVNNCTDTNGGWALGCRIDGGQAGFVRVPYADQGLNKIPETVTDEQALFVGDVLATGFWAASAHLGDHTGRYGFDHRCGADRYLHFALCYAESAEADHRLRKRCRPQGVCAGALPGYFAV